MTAQLSYGIESCGSIDHFFDNTDIRPTPQYMASLILNGLRDEDLIEAWRERGGTVPDIDDTLEEVDAILPYNHQISDKLAIDGLGSHMLVAGRDGEMMFDDLSIVHPNLNAQLLPISQTLLNRKLKSSPALRSRSRTRGFLREYEIDETSVMNPSSKFTFADTGFLGNCGVNLSVAINFAYPNNSVRVSDNLQIKLVSANKNAYGDQIMDFDEAELESKLPRTIKWIRPDRPEVIANPTANIKRHEIESNTYLLATAMQLLPRYHGPYGRLVRQRDDRVIALPTRSTVKDNKYRYNESNVHPLAAAIVQRRVVSSALERSRNLAKIN